MPAAPCCCELATGCDARPIISRSLTFHLLARSAGTSKGGEDRAHRRVWGPVLVRKLHNPYACAGTQASSRLRQLQPANELQAKARKLHYAAVASAHAAALPLPLLAAVLIALAVAAGQCAQAPRTQQHLHPGSKKRSSRR